MSARLALHLLGPPQIQLNNERLTLERRKALALLAYLALEPGSHSRETLSALLWPDYNQSNAFKNLRQVLWELPKSIGEGWLLTSREQVELGAGAGELRVDVREFESLFARGCAQDEIPLRTTLLEEAVELYRSHFLSGFSLKDAHPFDDWAFAKAEELRHKFSEVLVSLSEDHSALGQAERAIPYARRLVALDPINEAAHRQLMQVYLQAGQHGAALRQYQTCEQILRKELNLDPQPETRELYRKIRKGEIKPVHLEMRPESITPRHNLPHRLSTFIGREREQNEVLDLLVKKRLVTMVGAGGIGKTSLALQVGRKLLNDFTDGVWLIGLDSLSDPELTAQTVASIFGIRERGDQPLLDRLADSLQTKTALLIFDNCEHLLDACAGLITALLTRCPDLKVLATSREALGIPGEAIYIMASLPLPEGHIDSLEQLTEFESVRLFAERAALALTSFQLTEENIQTVVEICCRVDGIPLAIELAAAHVNILQVGEILAQLQDSFAVLTSDTRTILPRQQTLRGSMEWSWGLLSEAEQIFLRQLSVFAGGWTLESARAICDGNVLELSGALVKKSLIVVDRESGRETRYRFHEMLREFSHEHLINSGENEKIRTRHLSFFLGLAEQAEPELRGPALVNWMDRLNDERNNLRAALGWAEKTNVEAGLYLSGRLRRYWESANVQEGIRWLERFIHDPRSEEFPLARAHTLRTYGWLLTWLQQFEEARIVTEECLALFQAAGDRRGEADALISLANIKQFLDEPDAALELIYESLDLAKSLRDVWRQANAYYFWGWDRRDFKRAMMNWEKALHLYRQAGDQIALANILSLLGQFLVSNGEIERGEKYLDEALPLWQANNRSNIWENNKIARSLIAMMRGEHQQAAELLEEALLSSRETGNRMSYLWVRVRMAYAALRAGRLDEARDMFFETAKNFQQDGYTIGLVFALEGMAALDVELDKPEPAARLIGFADAMRRKIRDVRPNAEQTDVDHILSACLERMGEAAFSDAYEAGEGMTLDEAVTYALKEGES